MYDQVNRHLIEIPLFGVDFKIENIARARARAHVTSVGGRRNRTRCRAAPRDGARLAAARSPPGSVTTSQSVAADRWKRSERFFAQRARPCVSAYARASHSALSCRVASDSRNKSTLWKMKKFGASSQLSDWLLIGERLHGTNQDVADDGSRVSRNCHGQRNTGWVAVVVSAPNQREIFSEYLEKCWTTKIFVTSFALMPYLYAFAGFIATCDCCFFFRVALILFLRRRWCIQCVRATCVRRACETQRSHDSGWLTPDASMIMPSIETRNPRLLRLHSKIHWQYWKSIIYVCDVHYRFSVLAVNFGTQPESATYISR